MENKTAEEWDIFLNSIEEYSKHGPEKWTILTFLSYFLIKYKFTYGVDFIFSSGKKGPLFSKPMRDAKKIWSAFDRGRYQSIVDSEEKLSYKIQLVNVLKDYIDWTLAYA